MLGMAQWCRLSVGRLLFLAHVGVAQDAEALGVSGHNAVFDAIVDHLDKMAGAVGAAMQVTLFGRAVHLLAAWRTRQVTRARRKRREDRIEVLHHVSFAANHHAVTAFQTPHTT